MKQRVKNQLVTKCKKWPHSWDHLLAPINNKSNNKWSKDTSTKYKWVIKGGRTPWHLMSGYSDQGRVLWALYTPDIIKDPALITWSKSFWKVKVPDWRFLTKSSRVTSRTRWLSTNNFLRLKTWVPINQVNQKWSCRKRHNRCKL